MRLGTGIASPDGDGELAEVVATIHDHTEFQTGVEESRLSALSRLVETFSGKDVADNTPIVGRDVYTQTAGIHADGDAKGELYASRLLPARFGQQRRYVAVYFLFLLTGIPWYWRAEWDALIFGIPLWVISSVVVSFLASVFTAWLLLFPPDHSTNTDE